MDGNKEKIRYILQFFFDKGENVSQAVKIVNEVSGLITVTANYAQFWFRRFRCHNFDVKDAPRIGRPVMENSDKIMEMIEVDRHISSRSIAQELKIDHIIVLNHLHKAGFRKKLHVWVPHLFTIRVAPKHHAFSGIQLYEYNKLLQAHWEITVLF
ncbi:histone-lysine N-methyltransferase SETMAR-like [Cardiocondyla obscurior]|uniref:histone-lysine N-methyltransferase SETMAR-like n=1 Tax=Cardiocondyla obscurior TaxID=286306 RepID=UPI003965709D